MPPTKQNLPVKPPLPPPSQSLPRAWRRAGPERSGSLTAVKVASPQVSDRSLQTADQGPAKHCAYSAKKKPPLRELADPDTRTTFRSRCRAHAAGPLG